MSESKKQRFECTLEASLLIFLGDYIDVSTVDEMIQALAKVKEVLESGKVTDKNGNLREDADKIADLNKKE